MDWPLCGALDATKNLKEKRRAEVEMAVTWRFSPKIDSLLRE